MGLFDPMPSSHNVTNHMIGAVAFERSFVELYTRLQQTDPCDVSEGLAIISEAIRAEEPPYIDVARAAIVGVFDGGCGAKEMKYALRGYLAEATERFVLRAAEVETLHVRANLNALYGSGADAGWGDAADMLRR